VVAASADQIEMSGAAFVPISLKAHGSLLVHVGGRHSIGCCQNSSALSTHSAAVRIFSARLGDVDSKDSLLGANQIQGCFWEAVLGVKDRLVLSDAAWERMAPLIIGRPDQKGSTGRDNRMFVEGVLWIVRTGAPWRDLPEAFGDWNSVFRRFSRWSIKGVWWRIFEAMSDDPDFEYLIVDSTIVRAHQHVAGAKKGGLKIRRSAARAAA
jgi:transposase